MMYHCEGPAIDDVITKIDCINKGLGYHWVNQKYNFDNLGQVRQTDTHMISFSMLIYVMFIVYFRVFFLFPGR